MRPSRILVVEDERIVALHLKQQLMTLGYQIVAVASGEKALAKIVEWLPDLVLMDIHIEGRLDGIETAERIPPELQIPVIYLTAYSEETTLERAKATKPHGYLIKPYSERELHATIQMALERVRAESALRTSEDRFRSIVGAISEGIFLVDATGRFTEVNEPGSLMFGYQPGELIGADIETLSSGVTPYTQLEAQQNIERAAASGEPQRFDWHCKAKDGRLFWADISLRFASIGHENVVLSVVRDLTERRAIEEQLRQSQKMEAIGQLTGGIAHDFNNLLGVIIGNLDLLRIDRLNDPELDDLSGEALNAALTGADLTRSLLAFARRQPLQPRRIEIEGLLRNTAKLLARVLGENIEISLHFGAETCHVLADAAQLESALTNLATNARDAMPRGGKLLIGTARKNLDADYVSSNRDVVPGEYAMIEVTDTGEGMAPEVLKQVFEPFYTTKDVDKGTGLGLSMVYGFLKQSGGHVTVYSEVGVGTTFRLYLPCAIEAGATVVVAQAPARSKGAGERVLVVEDSLSLRRVACRQLRDLGYVVSEANDAADALAQLASGPVEVLFSDVVMPGDMDGFGLADAATRRWPDIKVVLTSGFPQTRLADGLATAKVHLLTKPYRTADLARTLGEALDAFVVDVVDS
jgi:PAS domain S-box-containing protein